MVRYLVLRPGVEHDRRSFAPGEILELQEGEPQPAGTMAMELRGSDGTMVSTGPWGVCLKECERHGTFFKPGHMWDWPAFKEPAPTAGGLFALVEDPAERFDFQFEAESNNPRARLVRVSEARKPKVAGPETGPDQPPAV